MVNRLVNIFSVFIVLILSECKSVNNKNDSSEKSVVTSYELDTSILKSKQKSALDAFIENYADSLNHIEQTKKLPFFLEDPQFDYHNSGIWSPSHHPLPLRNMIINRVTNCSALDLLIKCNNQQYKMKPVKSDGIEVEYSNFSFSQLAQKRYKELKCF